MTRRQLLVAIAVGVVSGVVDALFICAVLLVLAAGVLLIGRV